jgi:hypothetical protein
MQAQGVCERLNDAVGLFPGVNTITVEAKNCHGIGQSNPRTITFAPIASGTRFKFMGLEITQAIQDLDNTVPLIAGKRTFARAYLRVEGPTSAIREVSGVLTACRPVLRAGLFLECGASLPIDPTSSSAVLQSLNRITVNSSTDITVKRQDINASLNFELPPNWINAAELLHLEISGLQIEGRLSAVPCDGCDNLSPGLNTPRFYEFTTAPPVRVRLISVPYTITPPGGTPTTFTPGTIDFALLTSWLRRAYPSSTFDISPATSTTSFMGVPGMAFKCKDVNSKLTKIRSNDIGAGGNTRRRYYGLVVDTGGCMRGCAPVPGHVGSGPTGAPATNTCAGNTAWDTDASYGDWYGGHELGHTYGRKHAGVADACDGAPTNLDPFYPFPMGFIGDPTFMDPLLDFFGFDLGDAGQMIRQQVYAPNLWTDVMTYRCNQWISNYTYEGILARLRSEEGSSGASASSSALITASADVVGRESLLASESVLSDGLFVQGKST